MTILLCDTKTDFLSRARECMVNRRKEARDSCTNKPYTTLALSAGSLWTYEMLMGVGVSTFVNYNTARKWGQLKEKAYKMKKLRIDNK